MADLNAVEKYVENTRVVFEPAMTWRIGHCDGVACCLRFLYLDTDEIYQIRIGNYRTGETFYGSQQARLGVAGSAVFPSDSFDKLADGVNLFYQRISVRLARFQSLDEV
jgi:hypothetical protein